MTARRLSPLLLDEMFAPRIAESLSARGLDCRAVASDPSLVAASDEQVMEVALTEGRLLVTNNVSDFERLRQRREAESTPVPALIYTSDGTFPRDRRFVGRLVDALENAVREDLVGHYGNVLWLPTSSGT